MLYLQIFRLKIFCSGNKLKLDRKKFIVCNSSCLILNFTDKLGDQLGDILFMLRIIWNGLNLCPIKKIPHITIITYVDKLTKKSIFSMLLNDNPSFTMLSINKQMISKIISISSVVVVILQQSNKADCVYQLQIQFFAKQFRLIYVNI